MRQQHQIISRNNHDEHGTIGEHINTQWDLHYSIWSHIHILSQTEYTNSLVNATFGSGKKVVLTKNLVNKVDHIFT